MRACRLARPGRRCPNAFARPIARWLLLRVHSRLSPDSFRILLPLEQLAEGEVLHDRKFAQDLRIVHLQHALVDLSPSILDTRHVVQDGRVLPERSLLDVVNELYGGEVHVTTFVLVDSRSRSDRVGLWRHRQRPLDGRGLIR